MKGTFSIRTAAGAGAVLAALIAPSAALGAAQPTPTCRGLDATIVVTNTNAAAEIEGTEGADVIVVDISPDVLPDVGSILVDGLSGNDTICTSGVDNIIGGPGDDVIDAFGPSRSLAEVDGESLPRGVLSMVVSATT